MARKGRSMMYDPEINCRGVLMLMDPGELPVPEDMQRIALEEISTQIFHYVEEALKQKDDPWAALRVFVKGEWAVAEYTAEKFTMLEPLHKALQATLETFWRMARRQFLKTRAQSGRCMNIRDIWPLSGRDGWTARGPTRISAQRNGT